MSSEVQIIPSPEKKEWGIEQVLSTLVEWFEQIKNKPLPPIKMRESDRVFLDELNKASKIAEKLLLLIEFAKV